MYNNNIIKWVVVSFILRLLPLPLIGLITYLIVITLKGLLFYILLPVIILFLIILYSVLLIIFGGLIARAYGPIKDGVYDLYSKELDPWRAQVTFMTIIGWVQNFFKLPLPMFSSLFKLFLKAKIGDNVVLGGWLFDPSLVEIGNNTLTGIGVTISGHLIENNKVIIKRTIIGKNCTIGMNSTISPGVVIKDQTIIGAHSFVPKNKVLGPDKTYVGVPAKELSKK